MTDTALLNRLELDTAATTEAGRTRLSPRTLHQLGLAYADQADSYGLLAPPPAAGEIDDEALELRLLSL
jgi:hypothetical protein